MIVCSCNLVTEEAIRECLDCNPACPRTPAQVQRRLGCRPQCGTCFPSIRAIIERATPNAA